MFKSFDEYEDYLKGLTLKQLDDIHRHIDREAHPERFELAEKYLLIRTVEAEEKRKLRKPRDKAQTSSLRNAYAIVKDSINTLIDNPSMLVPLFCTWMIIAPLIIYLKFIFPWDSYTLAQQFLICFIVILLYSFVISLSNLILLEIIRQNESGRTVNLFTAAGRAMTINLIRVLPITFIWAILWFVISVLEVIFRRRTGDDEDDDDFTAENVTETLAGLDDPTLSAAFFEALRKGLRMIVFLILPAISWENLSPVKSVKKGLLISKEHIKEFMSGFVLTELAAALVFLPPAIIFILSRKLHVPIHDYIWFVTMLYCGLAWSFYVFIEQMFAAGLYLWHMKWEDECCSARAEDREMPALADVKRPIIMDNVPDLLNLTQKK